MRSEFSEKPLTHAIQLPVTIIQHAGTAEHPSSLMNSASVLASFVPSNGGPAPDHLVSKIWRHSPYCKDSPRYGLVVRENGKWVHKKSRGF